MDRSPLPFVSVVVPHFNDFDNLAVCLQFLRDQTWPRDHVEIIVADNNSRGGVDAVRALASDMFPSDILMVPAPEQGAGLARNAGVAIAKGEVLAFIDSDCVAEPEWLREGVEALHLFDYVGGQVITRGSVREDITASEAYELVFAFNFKKYIEKDKFSGTGNLFVPRKIFDQVGGFRGGVSEDVDWCRRANQMGFRLGYAPNAIVRHAARRDWSELTRKWDRVLLERVRLESERPGWRWRWLAHAAVIALSPLPHSFRVVTSRSLPNVHAKLLGVIGLFRIREYRAWRMTQQAIRFRLAPRQS